MSNNFPFRLILKWLNYTVSLDFTQVLLFILNTGSCAYKDFTGCLQLLGSRSEELAVCASLTSSNICVIPTNTPLKFVVSSLSPLASHIQKTLRSCDIFTQSFDIQIRRILISIHHDTSSHRARSQQPKIRAANNDTFKRYKRSSSTEQNSPKTDNQTTTADEGYRSNISVAERRKNPRRKRGATIVSILIRKKAKDLNAFIYIEYGR